MKPFLAVFLFWWSNAALAATQQACELDCLICDAVKDSAQYAEGAMKAMKEITPGDDHWLFRSDVDLSNDFGIPKAMEPEFARLMQALKRQNIEVAIAVQPTRGIMHRDKIRAEHSHGFDYDTAYRNLSEFVQQLRNGGATVADILPMVKTPPAEEYFFRRDHHWTPTGARNTARLMADEIKKLSVYEALSKKAYRSEKSVIIPKDGTMNTALRHVCGNNFSFQYVQGYQTVPDIDGSDALFGDESAPEVVLVGTSNSATREDEIKNFNFDGFLKEFLQTDLLNYALPGAGQDGALIQYFNSDDFDPEAPPKLLIWELPASYKLEDALMYRQLIPAISGGCRKDDQKILSNRLEFKGLKEGDRHEVLLNAGAERKDLTGLDGFLDIKFSDPNVKDFYVIVYYDNGERDKVWFRREAVVDGGQYYLELNRAPQFKQANVLSVFIEPTDPYEGNQSVEVKLCR